MKTKSLRRQVFLVLGMMVAGGSMGCVSSSTYELAKSNAENAKLLYQNEQRRSQELTASAKQMKQEIESLETILRDTREKLDRTDRDWRDTRDELLRLKIDREQQRRKVRVGDLLTRPEMEKPMPDVASEARVKPQPEPEDAKRRLKDLMQQLQSVIEHY